MLRLPQGFLGHLYAFETRPSRADLTINGASPQQFSARRKALNITGTFIHELFIEEALPLTLLSLGGCVHLHSYVKALLTFIEWPKTLISRNECGALSCSNRGIPEPLALSAHGHDTSNCYDLSPTSSTNYTFIATTVDVSTTVGTHAHRGSPNWSIISSSRPSQPIELLA